MDAMVEPLSFFSAEPSSSHEPFFDSEPSDWLQEAVVEAETDRIAELFGPGPASTLLDYARATTFRNRPLLRRNAHQHLLNKIPSLWRETELPVPACRKYDKAFACAWLSERLVAVGTKCNHLLCLDVATGQLEEVPLPVAGTTVPQQHDSSSWPYGHCGIHAISVSPDARLLATGGHDPAHCQVFEIRPADGQEVRATLRPLQPLAAHSDWIFGIAWVTDRHLVTGSRDATAKLWHLDEHALAPCSTPLKSQSEVDTKIRDVKYHQQLCRLLTLTTSGIVKIWDPHLNLIQKVQLLHNKEVVCMALCDQLVAVGSHSHVSLIDPRSHLPVKDVLSTDPSHGVRSLSFQGHILSSGSGRGHLGFFDLRAFRYLELGPTGPTSHAAPASDPCQGRRQLQLGRGWLFEDTIYRTHFAHMQIFNACYAHAWDPSCTKMISVGGPLPYGLRGGYMGLWD